MKKEALALVFAALLVPVASNAADGDTQGKLSKVVVLPSSSSANGVEKIRLYFKSSPKDNDRWGCINSPGYVDVSTGNPNNNVSKENLNRILSVAMTALTTDSTFAIDSAATDSCATGSMAWIIK